MSFIHAIAKLSPPVLGRSFLLPLLLISLIGVIRTKPSLGQSITPEPAPGGTGTTVTTSGNRYDIGGGSLSSDGKNLFHSFSQFGLQQNEIANFLSQPTIQNILARVNSGNPSVINGILQIYGGLSNLFLINPSGIVFGSGASLNIPASFTATTANAVGFGSVGWFNASGANDYAALVGTPSSLAFTMKQPAAIVNAANLVLQGGMRNSSLSLIGGTVASTGQLSGSPESSTEPGNNIIVAAVPGTSLVRLSQRGSPLSLEIQPLAASTSQPTAWTLPVLSLAQLVTGGGGSSATGLTVNKDGTVQLTGSGIRVENGNVVTGNINTSSLSAAQAGAILLYAKRDINTATGTLNSSASQGLGGGTITLIAQEGNVTTADINSAANSGYIGNGGAITIAADKNITTGNLSSFAQTTKYPTGGAIALTSAHGNIVTGTIDSHSTSGYPGNGGVVTLSANNGSITTKTISSYSSGGYFGGTQGGAITLTAGKTISTSDLNSGIADLSNSNGLGGDGGAITLTTNRGDIITGTLNSATSGIQKNGGAITVTAGNGKLTTGNIYSYSSSSVPSSQSSGNFSAGNGGAITLAAGSGTVSTGDLFSYSQIDSGDASNGEAVFANASNGGAVTVTSGQKITLGGINSGSSGVDSAGRGGSVTLSTRKDIVVSYINTQSGSQSGSYGAGGNISVQTSNSFLSTGAFTAKDGTTASISSTGGAIRIVTGGGFNNPFKVGDPGKNGTFKDITSGNYRIASTPVFTVPSPIYTQGNIEIITLP